MPVVPPSSSTDFEHINLADGEITPEDREVDQDSDSAKQKPAHLTDTMKSDPEGSRGTGSLDPNRSLERPRNEVEASTTGQGQTALEDPMKEIEEAAAKCVYVGSRSQAQAFMLEHIVALTFLRR